MSLRDPAIALYGLWAAFGVSWAAAAAWRGRAARIAARRETWPPLIVAGLGFAGLFAGGPQPRPMLWAAPVILGWAMVALAGAGFGLAWWARLHLGRLWSAAILVREGHRVIDSGPYAVVRHPIYTGLIAACAALAVIEASLPAIGGAGLVAAGFVWKARVEERFLGRMFGSGYAAYAVRVPMLVPFVR